MKRSIVWFKTDLRLHDNETLVKAIEHSDDIIPVYIFNPADYGITEFGFQKTGSFRARFIIESVVALDTALRAIGSGLVVKTGKPEVILPQLAVEYKAPKVYAKKEVAYEEKQQEDMVEKALWTVNCTLETFSTSTLYHAEDLPFSIANIPDVFTNFRKKVEKEASVRSAFAMPERIVSPTLPQAVIPTLVELGLKDSKPDSRAVLNFKGGEAEALKRLQHYFFDTKALSQYKETRNGLVGADFSSKFSAWLAQGCISPRYIYWAVKDYEKQYGANDSTYWLIFELLWRDYFRFMMKKHRQKFFMQTGIKDSSQPINKHDAKTLKTWIDGQTGIDFVDANMLELKLTGFMSNRGRQNVASYLCNDLKLDWRFGAAYFEQQLIDYDVCSNWGNWAYLAGVGNDPRGQRYFNIAKQADDYDKDRRYRNLWLSTKTASNNP